MVLIFRSPRADRNASAYVTDRVYQLGPLVALPMLVMAVLITVLRVVAGSAPLVSKGALVVVVLVAIDPVPEVERRRRPSVLSGGCAVVVCVVSLGVESVVVALSLAGFVAGHV